MVLLGMRYAKGPDGSKGFSIGRGTPLPGSLPPLQPLRLAKKIEQDEEKAAKPPPEKRPPPAQAPTAEPVAVADPTAPGAKSWASMASARNFFFSCLSFSCELLV